MVEFVQEHTDFQVFVSHFTFFPNLSQFTEQQLSQAPKNTHTEKNMCILCGNDSTMVRMPKMVIRRCQGCCGGRFHTKCLQDYVSLTGDYVDDSPAKRWFAPHSDWIKWACPTCEEEFESPMNLMIFIGKNTRIPNYTRPEVIDLSSESDSDDDDDEVQVVDATEANVKNIVMIDLTDDFVPDEITPDFVTEIISDPYERGFFSDSSSELTDDFNDDSTVSSYNDDDTCNDDSIFYIPINTK